MNYRYTDNHLFIFEITDEKILMSPLFEATNSMASTPSQPPLLSVADQEILRKECQMLEIGHTKEIVLAKGTKEEIFCNISRIAEKTAIASLIYTAEIRVQEINKKAHLRLVELTGIVRHDLMNQITAIMGYFEIMSDMIPEELVPYMEKETILFQNVRNIIESTRHFQTLGNRQASWISVQDAIKRYQKIQPFHELTLSGSLEGVEIFVDPEFNHGLSRVLEELKKTHPFAEVTCGWEIVTNSKADQKRNKNTPNDDYLCIWFSDNSEFFSECAQKKVFQNAIIPSGPIVFYMFGEICNLTDIKLQIITEPICRFEILVPTSSYQLL